MPASVPRPALLAICLASVLLAPRVLASSPLSGPPAPPRVPAFEAGGPPLDVRLGQDPVGTLTSKPGNWCPTGPEFVRWLEERLPGARASRGTSRAKSHGAGPNITWTDNIVLMEDDGSLMRFDRRPDLEGLSVEFTPDGDDYLGRQVLPAYEADIGNQVLLEQRSWTSVPVDLTLMTFPFGGVPRNRIWLTPTFVAAFADPAAPGPAQLRLSDVIADRTPRIAPLQQGSSFGGWNAFVREYADRVVLTWRATDGGGYDADVQVVLHADGRIGMTWARLRGVVHGSVVIIDGDDAWWNDRQPGGSVTSPPDEVATPAPDGPATDLLEVAGYQVGGSEILQIELITQAPLPAATDGTLQFAIEIRDEPGGPVLFTAWFEWQDGSWNWTNAPAEVLPSGFRFSVNRTSLNLADDDIEIVAWTATNWAWGQVVITEIAWPTSPPTPLMRDWSVMPPGSLRGPLVESFTLPELDVYAVYNAYMSHFGSPAIDGLAIYQNFLTDIVFYAGAYSTVGNAGADGIGAGNSTDPKSPALLHMNTIRYGWSSWDEGKVTVLNHEFGHHWLYFYSMMEGGVPTKSCGDGHPAGWTHTQAATPVYQLHDASCMGGSTWTDNADGTFTSGQSFASFGFSWHELYLMGLADAAEVADWFYLANSNPPLPGAYWPQENLTVTADRVDVALQQVIDAMGPRNPAWPDTQREFIVPMVLIVRPGEYSQADIDEVERTCQVWKPRFRQATVDRGEVICDRIGDRPPVVAITDPPVDLIITEGSTLSFTGIGTDDDLDAVTLTWDFAGLAPVATAEGPHDVTFPDPGTYVITLSGEDATGRVAAPPATRTVTVECAAPAEMSILRVGHDRDLTLTFSLDPGSPAADEHVVGAMLTLPDTPLEIAAGALPLTIPQPAEDLVFFRLAGRNLPDCLGPW